MCRALCFVTAAFLIVVSFPQTLFAQGATPHAVVFFEAGFPSADAPQPDRASLAAALPAATFSNAQELKTALADTSADLLVLPFGSAFPEAAWPDIQKFLSRGGNLLAIGGRPFLSAAYVDQGKWKLRNESVRFTRQLYINDYRETPGSNSLQFLANPDFSLDLPQFAWRRAFSPIIRLSTTDIYPRQGSAGSLDARLETLVWGDRAKTHFAAPIIQIDHLQHSYVGGRWIFIQCELEKDFYQQRNTPSLLARLAEQAARGSEQLTLRPRVPLFTQAEPLRFHLTFTSRKSTQARSLKITITPEEDASAKTEATIADPQQGEINLPAVKTKGFHHVEAKFYEGAKLLRIYHSGFWIRDEQYLLSGPKLTVNSDYFELDGRPLPVVGTTYMSSEVQRLFFSEPNAYAWDRDMAQISASGLNMIRTGWWTDWSSVANQGAEATDDNLRNLEAFLMTARRHNLPVQFTFFAFLPDVLGGSNPYLDPVAIARQQKLVLSVVRRFKDVPFLAYDLINEPSFSQYTWRTRPNGDQFELAAWNQWLEARYPDRASLLDNWNLPMSSLTSPLPLPKEQEFQQRGEYTGHNSLKLHDFYLFAQDSFSSWVDGLRRSIRKTGSKQLITVGQDDGGIAERLNPAFFGGQLDFTTNHTWWLNNELLWCSLVAKHQGQPMLVQETGLQRELTLNERARRTDENEAALFERKLAMSFVQGTGVIQWLWNLNTYMSEDNEVPIGSVRADGTMKPEGRVLSEFAQFVGSMRDHFKGLKRPDIAIITSQILQYSVLNGMASTAQQRAVRSLSYGSRLSSYVVAENQLAKLGNPKLAILPSPQGMTLAGWDYLSNYVNAGGTLLITGPIARDEHWQDSNLLASFGPKNEVMPITFSEHTVEIDGKRNSFHFDLQAQNLLEWVRFTDGKSFNKINIGKGQILWVDVPIELSGDLDSIASVYSAAATMAHVQNDFTLKSPLGSGVLISSQGLQDDILYIFSSESSAEEPISLRDNATGATLNFRLAAQRAALIFIRRSDGKIVGMYGVQ
jgi:hypothetical protein